MEFPPKPELPLGRYRHFRGAEYEVTGMSRDTETEEWRVLYKSLPETAETDPWDRPHSLFVAHVEYEGRQVPRFQYLGEREVVQRVFNLSDFTSYSGARGIAHAVPIKAYQGVGRLYVEQSLPNSLLATLPAIRIGTISEDHPLLDALNASFRDVDFTSFRAFVTTYENERAALLSKTSRKRYDQRLPFNVGRRTMEFYQSFLEAMVDNET